jgi:hypothetical protein
MLAEANVLTRFLTNLGNAAMAALRLTSNQSLAVAQVEPPNAEMARAGRRFALGYNPSAAGVFPVVAIPSTAAQWVLYNPTTSKRTLFLEQLGLTLSAGTPAAGGVTLYGQLIRSPAAVDGANFANTSNVSLSGGGLASKAILKSAVVMTDPVAANSFWTPIAELISANVAVFPGSNAARSGELGGAIAIPPGFGLALAAVGPIGTGAAYLPIARWCEFESDTE